MRKNLLISFIAINLMFIGVIGNAQSIFINEIHYDNSGTDAGEAIEIAGPAGTDLNGWSVLLYNGNGGAVYATKNLSQTIIDSGNGFGFVPVLTTGIQNGSPDGFALVNAVGEVVQFLSYEGSFAAVGGAADGMLSTDIGVSETSTTGIGESLQLTGTGTEYTDFVWATATANTFGGINSEQNFGTQALPVLINEFVFDHIGSDTKEFVEILSNPATDLSAYTILEIEGDGTGTGVIDEVITLGTTDEAGYFTTAFGSNQFENGTVTLLLVKDFTGTVGEDLDLNNDGTFDTTPWSELVDDVASNDGGIVYAQVVLEPGYDGNSFQVGGASRIPNGTDTDSPSDWVRNDYNGEGILDGAEAQSGDAINTPGAENSVKEVLVETTIIINEVDADTEGTDVAEFIELYDGGVGNTALDGFVVVLYNGNGDASYNVFDLAGYTTNEAGYFVLGNSGVENVQLTFNSNGLQNGADAVALYQGTAAEFPNGTLVTTTNLVDALVYDTNDSDDEGLLVLLNADEAQINEDEQGDKDIHSLQRYANGEGGLRNTSTYVAALPTPGAANTNRTEEISLVINEVDADTEGTDVAEFIELYDGGVGNTALDGFVVVLYNGNGDASYNVFDLAGYTTNEAGYFVLGNSGVENVQLTFNSNGLQNGADAVALYQGTAAEFPNGTLVTTTNLVDALVYDTNDSDDEGLLVLLNADEAQINEDEQGDKDIHSLQRIPNGLGGARNTLTFTQAPPTPGTENGTLVEPPAADTLSILDARNAAEGSQVVISGTLTVTDQFNGSAFIQDATAGIAVYDPQVHGAGLFAIGDSVTITGERAAYNEMIQISNVSAVVSHGPALNPVQPVVITLAQLADYAGQLVRIDDAAFPSPGGLLFGNTNFELTDASGSGEMRLDADVDEIVGLAQPELCEVTGVVGRYYNTLQLMPRIKTDLPCASEFTSEDGLGISKDVTLDVVTWNLEWFGDEGNSPAGADADLIQKDSVKAAIIALDADIIGMEEIADDVTFAQMISEIPGFDFILSDATSYPDGDGVKQKVGFVYKTATVNPVSSKVLLAAAHPYYNGGDASMLSDYPNDPTRFFASGRMPFMLTADVTIGGSTERISFIDLHARANGSSGSQDRYDMRKYDVEALKDTLDTYYANEKIVMVGDYNDDVDETVADVNTTVSTFQAYVDDEANYSIPTSALSDANLRSYVFYPNMIDHVMLTNELFANYIDGSARVHYEFYGSDYTYTTSDHFPVSVRLQLKSLELVSISATDVDCYGASNGTATVEVAGGIEPYTYLWSDGQTTATAENMGPGTYTVSVSDFLGNEVSGSVAIYEAAPIEITLSGNTTVYPAYSDSACTTIFIEEITGGTGTFTFEWSTGETTESIVVCPQEETEYTVTVSDENGCLANQSITIRAIDVDCSNNTRGMSKIEICYNGKTKCIALPGVAAHLRNGATLGACFAEETQGVSIVLDNVLVYPNPVKNNLTISFTSQEKGDARLVLLSNEGSQVASERISIHKGYNKLKLKMNKLVSGTYIVSIVGNGVAPVSQTIIKQ